MLKKFFVCLFVLVFGLTLSSCKKCEHVDKDDNLKCDICGKDYDDGKEECLEHVDDDGNNVCDKCEESLKTEESIKDQFNCITVAEAIKLAKEAGSNGTSQRYYVYGKVVSVENSMYGSMTIQDETGSIYVYGVYDKDEKTRYDAMDEKPVAGDEVVLYGVLKTYNDEPEMDRGYLQAFNHIKQEVDTTEYKEYSVADARELGSLEKVKLSGVVAQITYAFGPVPNGFYLVDSTGSIYIYGTETAGQVKVGNTVTVIGEKTYYVAEKEQANANKYGYKGCCQIQNVTLVENDKKVSEFDKSWIEESTVKEIMETEISSNITTNIYKVNALIKKVVGTGFTNYYIDDLDGYTGSYVYTACSGEDFAWLDQYDGKICTVYLSPINAKSTASGCIYRFIPVLVIDEGFKFNEADAPSLALEYYAKDQFLKEYQSDPEILLKTSVSNELLNLENIAVSYESSDNEVAYFEKTDEGIVFHTKNDGTVTITINATYKEYSASIEVTIKVSTPVTYETITVKEAIESVDGTEVTVKGIVVSSLVNQSGFYLSDETGIIAVTAPEAEVALLSAGDEVVIRGIKSHKVKDPSGRVGQINIYNSTVLVNYYGNHDYCTDYFDNEKTLAELYALNPMEDHTTEVYVVDAIVEIGGNGYYTNIKIKSTDGKTTLSLYCSSANQYSFLKQYAGKTVTLELAMCNWNDKTYYTGCVISVTYEGVKTINTLNFNE